MFKNQKVNKMSDHIFRCSIFEVFIEYEQVAKLSPKLGFGKERYHKQGKLRIRQTFEH